MGTRDSLPVLWVGVLLGLAQLLVLVTTVSISIAQENDVHGADACQPLDTESSGFGHIEWHWIDNETVFFTVGHPTESYVGRPLGERTTTTYVYSFAEGVVTTLPANPLISYENSEVLIRTLRPEVEGDAMLNQPIGRDYNTEEAVIELSLNARYAIYLVADTSEAIYRLALFHSNEEFVLDIPSRDLGPTGSIAGRIDTVWSDESDTFVLQGRFGLTNAYVPATLNTITEAGIDSRRLTDLKPLSGSEYLQFIVHGLSPSGHYLIIDSLLPFPDGSDFPDPRYSRIIDVETEESIDLPMDFPSWPPVAWLSDDTFRAHTTLGVIDYSISTQSFEVVLTPEFMEDIQFTSFSFDGSYMIGVQTIELEEPNSVIGGETVIIACNLS